MTPPGLAQALAAVRAASVVFVRVGGAHDVGIAHVTKTAARGFLTEFWAAGYRIVERADLAPGAVEIAPADIYSE